MTCLLRAAQKEAWYDPQRKEWTVDDGVFAEIGRRLQTVIDCASDGDTILFKTTDVLRPRKKIMINKNIKLQGSIPDANLDVNDADSDSGKVKFTCPSESQGVFEIE